MGGIPAGHGDVSEDWAAVYRSTFSDLVRYLYRKVWDAERAQDLAQETFVRVLDQERRGTRTRAVDNPRALIFTVAANLARDEARTVVRRRKHLALLKSEAEARPHEPDPVAEMTAAGERQRAQAALAKLGDRDREVLLLWDAGLSYDDIAAQTGLAPGAIGTTLSRARRRLVTQFQAMEAGNAARG
jgi:RNA polymerase sigma-70 factor (ECF subfamily)